MMTRSLTPVPPCCRPVGTVARPHGVQGKEWGAPAWGCSDALGQLHPLFGVGRGRQDCGDGRRVPALPRTLNRLPPSCRISTSDTRFVPTCFQRGADGEAAGCDSAPLHSASPSRALRRQKNHISPRSTGIFISSQPKRHRGSASCQRVQRIAQAPGTILARSHAARALAGVGFVWGLMGCTGN